MASFENGIASYVVGRATVTATFPVDYKGNASVCCQQCFFYRDASRRCGLTGEISQYPTKYVGGSCPLEIVEDDEDDDVLSVQEQDE